MNNVEQSKTKKTNYYHKNKKKKKVVSKSDNKQDLSTSNRMRNDKAKNKKNDHNTKYYKHKLKTTKPKTKKSFFDYPIEQRKYRISIVESMSDEKVIEYGFEKSYYLFERSINNMSKEGDKAEKAALNYLKKKHCLSDNYRTNRVIALNTIKIEADIIDYDNKIIYETKSRKTGMQAKMAIKKKWAIFEHDKKDSNYEDYTFKGIVVSNYENGMKIKGIAEFDNQNYNEIVTAKKFINHFDRIDRFRKLSK